MFGDDTWLKLFPGRFVREDGTTSFFVSDYTEVSCWFFSLVDSRYKFLAAMLTLILHFSSTTVSFAAAVVVVPAAVAAAANLVLAYPYLFLPLIPWLMLIELFFFCGIFLKSFINQVDKNVSRHLDVETASRDWDASVLHYLGLDHIGHLAGPSSPLVPGKLVSSRINYFFKI